MVAVESAAEPVRILLVEDNRDHAELITRAFEEYGGQILVERANDLSTARRILEEAPPDLVIMDLVLPDGGGLELLGSGVEPSYPTVVMTSHGDERVAVEAMKAGVLDYVVKTDSTLRDLPRVAERALREWNNIRERERAEQALLQSEAHYRSLIDNALDLITVLDENTTVLYQSPSVVQLLGYAPEEMLGRSVLQFVHPDDREAFDTMLAVTITEFRSTHSLEYRIRDRAGRWHTVESLASCHPSLEGRRQAVINTRDISHRRETDRALRESESRHRTLVDSLPLCIYEIDLEGYLVTMNRAGRTILELDSEAFLGGQTYLDVIDPVDQSLVSGHFREATQGIGSELEYRAIVHGKPKVFAAGFIPLTTAEGNVIRILGHAQDVTERRRAEAERERLEEQLRHSQKMEALGQLAAGVAHDFNNLLTVVAGHTSFVEMALESAGGQAVQSLAAIRGALERATALSRQLLAFGRRQVLRPVVLDLNEVVANVEKLIRRLIGEHIELEVALLDDAGTVRADPVQLEQAILNLTMNARDSMPDGGRLSIRTSHYRSEVRESIGDATLAPGRWSVLAVEDSGCGMSQEVQAQIFEPFFTTKDRGKGTGLGLSTAYGIVTQSGGHIGVDSRLGKGTTFVVYLPYTTGDAESTISLLPQKGQRGDERILVVEDDDEMRHLIRDILTKLGYRVLVAAGGDQALEIADERAGRIDLLLTDLVMPGMNGRDLGRRFQEAHPECPILYMSGYSDDGRASLPSLSGRPNFLEKPFTPAVLSKAVRDVLEARPSFW